MAAKQRNIFHRNKPIMDIYKGVDHEGKQVEVREDAEQLVKWHEISDALVGAGYYRAQLQGLSAFDKIVGGLSWCIELCDIGVDISLLFEENLTIGKKIALTEKIVKVLPSIKCPHIIEPHQIQGLDFINIYPLVQWLIKYSSEFREANEDELRKFAVLQYEKDHIFEVDRANFIQNDFFLRNLSAVQDLYKPCRVRKRKGGFPTNELEQVNATLSEYDQRMLMHVSVNKNEDGNDEGLDFLYDYEKTLADPSEITTEAEKYDTILSKKSNIEDTKIHYAVLHSELTGELSKELEESEKLKYSEDIDRLTKTIDATEEEMKSLKDRHSSEMEKMNKKYKDIVENIKNITTKLMKSEDLSGKKVKDFYKTLKDLGEEKNKLQETAKQKEKEILQLEHELRSLDDPSTALKEDPLTPSELKEFQEREDKLKLFISNMRLELAQLNREVLRYTIAIDEVPSAAELLQYEKRFIELYNQVSSKHKETKQYYIFYNTLYEVKSYTTKELSLLNSILDTYEDAMSSNRKREEFMSKFESIVELVNQTVKKVEVKFNQEKLKKAALHSEYTKLLDVQRQYAAALKTLAADRQKIGKQKKIIK